MPKPKYIISDSEKNLIHHELYKKTGILIRTKSDCRIISELIEASGELISESTLYRMFIQKKQSYTPYMHTLNVLSMFCGFERWQDLIQNNERHTSSINTITTSVPEVPFDSFVQVSIALKEYKVLKNYFLQFPLDTPDSVCHIIGNDVFKSLFLHQNSCKSFYKEFSNVPIIRKSFFELLADPEFALEYYDFGLHNYLINTNNDSSLNTTQDELFARSLLTRHYFFNNQEQSFEKVAKELYSNENNIHRNQKEIDPFPLARYLIYKILYLKAIKSNQEQLKYEHWLLDFLQDKQESLSYPESKIWIHTLLDIMPHMAQPKAYKKFICSTILKFNELYPKSYRKPVKDIDFEHLKQYTNSNSSAYWKQIWATQT